MEDSGAEDDVKCRGLTQEVSKEKNISKCPRDYSCVILVKNESDFCPCPKTLPEAKLESFGLTALMEEISRYLVLVVWLVY